MARRDTTPPTVNITSPVNGTQYLTNTTITITATGNDAKGVTLMRLFVIVPGSTYATRQQIATASFAAKANTVRTITTTYAINTIGNYTIIAEAFDAAGNSASSQIFVTRNTSTTTSTTTVAPPPVLPSSKILIAPPVQNQGGEGSCAAFAAVLQASIEKYYYTNATSYSESTNILSPEWIYDIALCGRDFSNPTPLCGNCGNGSGLAYNTGTIYDIGTPRWSVCPYSFQTGCTTAGFTQAMTDDAALNKYTWYGSILSSDIYQMKRALCNNHALTFAFTTDSNYYNSTCGYIWNSRGTLGSSHAMVIIGYDDSKNAWLAQNSWGPNWGCNGQIWIDYNFFTTTLAGNVYWATMKPGGNVFDIL